MPTGGTLLIGREQDCEGGCFDSAPGVASHVAFLRQILDTFLCQCFEKLEALSESCLSTTPVTWIGIEKGSG